MNCFNHPETVAVAGCRNCGKALCKDCSRESVAGISCSDACQTELKDAYDANLEYRKQINQAETRFQESEKRFQQSEKKNKEFEKAAQKISKVHGSAFWIIAGIIIGLFAAWAFSIVYVAWRATQGMN